MCLDGAKVKEAVVEEHQQQEGGDQELGVLSRVREITSRITNTMKAYMRWCVLICIFTVCLYNIKANL